MGVRQIWKRVLCASGHHAPSNSQSTDVQTSTSTFANITHLCNYLYCADILKSWKAHWFGDLEEMENLQGDFDISWVFKDEALVEARVAIAVREFNLLDLPLDKFLGDGPLPPLDLIGM
jgi:hypothetical protein